MFLNSFPRVLSFLSSILIFLAIPGSVSAQSTLLNVSAPDYSGKTITLLQTEDYLSGARSIITQSGIPDNGQVSLRLELKETRELILSIGQAEAVIHARPGQNYTLEFPAISSDQVRRFDVSQVDIIYPEKNRDEMNLSIRSFNQEYTHFINTHYFDFAAERYRGSEVFRTNQASRNPGSDMLLRDPEKADSNLIVIGTVPFEELVSSFTFQVNEKYGHQFADPYFRDYVQYAIAELELLSGHSHLELYRTYLHGRTVQPHHPSYMKFFELFYAGTLSDQPAVRLKEIQKIIHADQDGMALANFFSSDSLYQSKTVRELAIIKGLRDEYNNPIFSRKAIENTLIHLSRELDNPVLSAISQQVSSKLMRCKKDWALEDFTLLDTSNERWKWSEQPAEYTYFLFVANWCTQCKKELQALKATPREVTRNIRIVVIGMDESNDDFRKLARSLDDTRFTFLYGGSHASIRQIFQMRAIPHAVLINPAGKFVHDYTRKPTEGISSEFEKISSSKNKDGGTWRD